MRIIFLTVVVDQAAKFAALKFLDTTCNQGIAFGIGFGDFSLVIPAAVVVLVSYLFVKEKRVRNKYALALILGGGISNLVDRIARGCVVDFIPWPLFSQLPAFNLADAAISVGVGLLVVSYVKNSRNNF